MDYFVQYVGHVNERLRPEYFPKLVYVNVIFQVANKEELQKNVNQFAAGFIAQQAMIVFKDPESVQGRELDLEKRMIVPMGMLSHIDCNIKLMSNSSTIKMGQDGKIVSVDREGKETEVKPS